MRTTSQTWKNIVAKGEFNMESVARIYGATGSDTNGTSGSDSRGSYKEYATITAPVITRALLSGDAISVGNTIASQLNFTVMTTDTIPKSAMIVIRARVKNNNSVSEWLEFGTYWIDHRSKNDELTDIEAYDAMKKGNQGYSDNSQSLNWPKTIKVVVQRIAQQIGVSIDSRTTTEIINSSIGDLNIVLKPNDDEVLLDVLRHIGEVLGGNWTITDNNQLRFITTVSPPNETYYIVDEAHNLIKTEQGDYLIHEGESQEHAEQTHPAGGGTCFVPVVLGSIATASKYTISKITIALDSDHVYSYGDNTGFELIVSESNPYASDALAQLLYSRVNGIEYSPFEITNAVYDPATELGDWIVAGAVYGVLYNDKRTLDVGFYADISAPGRDELEDEYPYRSFTQKTEYQIESAQKEISVTKSEINQRIDGIVLSVSNTYETKTDSNSKYSTLNLSLENLTAEVGRKVGNDEIRSKFALDPSNITLSAGTDSSGNPTGTITFNAGTMIVNGNNFSVDRYGHLECIGATLNGTFVSITQSGAADQFKTEAKNGILFSYYNDVLYGMVGLVGPTGSEVYGIAPAGSGTSVTLDARRLSDIGEITHNGSYIRVDENGRIEICGNYIYIRRYPDDVATEIADSGYFYDRDGNTINVLNGMIVGGLRHS